MAKSYRKRSPRTYKKRRNYNRRKRLHKNVMVRSSVPIGLGFPKKLCITHKYADKGIMTCASGVMQTQLFVANGMYDPDYSGLGHQPIYFDEISALYDHYVVIGSRIRVTFGMYPGQSGFGNFRCGLFISDTNTPSVTNFNALAEQGTARWKMLSGDVTTGPMDQRSLRHKWSAKKYFGKGVLANTELQGTGSTNPTEKSYFCLAVEPLSDTVTESLQYTVEIDYIAVWKEVKALASS